MPDPRTAAWQRLREELADRREEFATEGFDVATATADHGAATVDGDTARLVFTVADDTADDVAATVTDATPSRTTVEVVDVAGVRLFLLSAVAPGEGTALLVAGGVDHDAVASMRAASTARTVLRRADGTRVAALDHDDVAPFVADL